MPRRHAAGGASGDVFGGHYRKAVKTSIWRHGKTVSPTEPIGDLGALLDSLVPDLTMLEKYPKLEVSPTASNAVKLAAPSTRFAEEQRNVAVRVWLWYVRKEADNDFHLLIGSSAHADARYMTAEVSGLPTSGPDVATLRLVRSQLVRLVGHEPNNKHYEALTPPLHVRITGSLFFDGGHQAGQVGPTGHHPQTVWEIHPVTSLKAI